MIAPFLRARMPATAGRTTRKMPLRSTSNVWSHFASSRLASAIGGMVRRVQSLEPIEAPARLVSAILDQTLGPRAPKHGWRSWLAWVPSLLQPRFAIGMATAAASLVILLYAAGLNPAKIHKADLNPINIYRSMNRQSHLVYARSVKYVNDLRVVYEIQSRLRPPDSPAREEQPPHFETVLASGQK